MSNCSWQTLMWVKRLLWMFLNCVSLVFKKLRLFFSSRHNPPLIGASHRPLGIKFPWKLDMENSRKCKMSTSACFTYETGILDYEDFPRTEEPVWILGRKYSTLYDIEELRADVRSKVWLTYRKNFPPIGGTGPVTDTGWGCMLRCGQMVLSQALINRHLGRDWRWNPDAPDPVYLKILRKFEDKKNCPYSIHQIAQMGVSEGKAVGQWFGPNTVAQVIKKLAVYDDMNSLAIHVAMDSAVIIDDIKTVCLMPETTTPFTPGSPENGPHSIRQRYSEIGSNGASDAFCHRVAGCFESWRPLLLFVPLRLGLSEINPIYFRGLKATFTLKQSLGIIGGRPNHALYFIGTVGNELVFLDPHTTQLVTNLSDANSDDNSYHCPYASRMDIHQLDPSIALCFYFNSEADFDSWCNNVHQMLLLEKQPLFELSKERPHHWPPFEPHHLPDGGSSLDFTFVDQERKFDTSDDEFELLG